MRYLISFLFIFTITLSFSQESASKQEKDIIVTQKGETISCYIKNFTWKSSPDEIKYKLNKKSKKIAIPLTEVKELNFKNGKKFIAALVELDNASNRIEKLTYEKQFKFVEKRLLLKKLVVGNANLYASFHKGKERFFYNTTETDDIVQLLYKRFIVMAWIPDNTQRNIKRIADNKMYLNQIKKYVTCDQVNDIQRLAHFPYDKNRLIQHFESYNEKCK